MATRHSDSETINKAIPGQLPNYAQRPDISIAQERNQDSFALSARRLHKSRNPRLCVVGQNRCQLASTCEPRLLYGVPGTLSLT